MEFDVHITAALLHRVGVRRLFRRWPLDLGAMLLILIGVSPDIAKGHFGIISTVALTICGFKIVIYAASYFRLRRSVADWERLQGDAPVHYQLTSDTLRAQSNLGRSELRWSVFRELLEHRDFLLLGLGRSGLLTLPVSDVPAEAHAFIRERFASHGLPVKKA